jgi:hypothetical protein
MAIPDCPGLGHHSSPDFLTPQDLQHIISQVDTPSMDIAFIKGFVQTGDVLEGDFVETLKKTSSGTLPLLSSQVKPLATLLRGEPLVRLKSCLDQESLLSSKGLTK